MRLSKLDIARKNFLKTKSLVDIDYLDISNKKENNELNINIPDKDLEKYYRLFSDGNFTLSLKYDLKINNNSEDDNSYSFGKMNHSPIYNDNVFVSDIIDYKIVSIFLDGIVEILYNDIFSFKDKMIQERQDKIKKILYNGLDEEVERYTINRLLNKIGVLEEDSWVFVIKDSIYGKNLEEIRMSERVWQYFISGMQEFSKDKNLIDRIISLFRLENINYDYDSITNPKIIKLPLTEIDTDNFLNFEEVQTDTNLDRVCGGIIGLVEKPLNKGGKYKLISGYERYNLFPKKYTELYSGHFICL
jgi:hypothetical protein